MKKIFIALLLMAMLAVAVACAKDEPVDTGDTSEITTTEEAETTRKPRETTAAPETSETTEAPAASEVNDGYFIPESGTVGDGLTVGSDAGMDGDINKVQ